MQDTSSLEKPVPWDEVVAQRLAALPAGPKPRDVRCPTCGAEPGAGCRTKTGYDARTHTTRWHAIGIAKPSDDDLARDYWDGERRRLDARVALYAGAGAALRDSLSAARQDGRRDEDGRTTK